MADIKFSCPYCGQHTVGAEALTGMYVECPACRHHFTVTQEMITWRPPVAEPTREFVLPQTGAHPKKVKEGGGGGCCFGVFVGFVMSTIFFVGDRGHSSYTVYLVVGLIAGAVGIVVGMLRSKYGD